MSRSNPRSTFGIHEASFYSRTDRLFYGSALILDNSSISISGEQIKLQGGSNRYDWAVEDGQITAEMSLKIGQFENWMVELFLGKAPTALSAEASGNVSTLTNYKGTSVMHATTGIASVAALAGSEANLKFGKYTIKAVSATTVKIYIGSDIDLKRGTDVSIDDDNLSVTSAAQTITSGANTDITALGLRLAGGSGTIGMTTGDTATFEVRPIASSGGMTVTVGGSTDIFPEFGAILMAQARSNGELFEIDAFRCKANGMPIGFEAKAWNKPEVKAALLYDTSLNGVFGIRAVKPA